ncbi:P-loop containing nucleoside triphosphate hydrolase protein [Massarina eburnea CBS 473.64]|uniref:P-loop containing nucleoside triphosphate hydrolase protein n=1 Tax=Massarina eburnea CBS 473.64 TaxID=1395130 RepID=A0A6A6S0K6_9PLEO|nr:P-loop containing nucleoside triphosphate hydrolase protein [Massarina eburnea CBS 473.64]
MPSRSFVLVAFPRAKPSCLAPAPITRRAFSTTRRRQSQYRRSDFTGQGFASWYDPDEPTRGPLGDVSGSGVSRITPRKLKEHLDQFVVGQSYAKTVLSAAVYGHYLRIRELHRQEEEQALLDQKRQRQAMVYRHPVEEDEFPGQQPTMPVYPSHSPPDPPPLEDTSPLQIEKSNVLMLGPTGVGKTLITKTLARVLDVPYSMSDCTPFTQSGYIGEDAESCVARLLAAANYDVDAAECGIIVLDEIDKIAGVKVAHGKDVGGEGVQQSLLKIIEGTTLQIQAKAERSGSNSKSPSASGGSGYSSNNSVDGSRNSVPGAGSMAPGGKGEVFNVRTDNILFICTGAFINLEKIILNRKAKGGLGFGAQIRSSNPESGRHETRLSDADVAAFSKDMPIYIPVEPGTPITYAGQSKYREEEYNILNYVEPSDLQKYGMIPELIGRIPNTCAVSSLDEEALVRVLTEPKNSLIRQETALFHADGIDLRFTSASLREIAKKANAMGTGARGLKAVMERLLLRSKFEAPGSTIKHILVTQEAAQLKRGPLLFHRGQSQAFENTCAQEEDDWQERLRAREEADHSIGSFEEYRKVGVAGY